MSVDYYQYIQSEEWRQRANEAKQRAGYRCRVCNRSSKEVVLNAHHRTYKRLGHEHPDDITVLCRDCHELYELNRKIPRPPQQQYQPTTYQTTSTPQSYTVNQSTQSKELVLPERSGSNFNSAQPSAKVVVLTFAGVLLAITLITVIISYFSPIQETTVPIHSLTSSPTDEPPKVVAVPTSTLFPLPPTATPPATFNTPSEPDGSPDVVTIAKDVEFHNGPGMGRPILGTLVQGRTVIISGYTICDQTVWYHVAKHGWVMGEFVDSASINVPYHDINCPDSPKGATIKIPKRETYVSPVQPIPTKRPATPTDNGPSPADCANETNKEWAALCWDAVADRYRDDMPDYESYDYYYEEEPYYYDPFEDGRFVDGP